MKLFKQLALSSIVLSSVLSSFTSANEMEITAKSQVISKDSKLHTYSGNVRIAFADGNLSTKSSHASFEKDKTVLEGDVEIILSNAIAKTDRVTFTPSQHGFVAEMDLVTFTYK
jgi:lipopolysaccharide assembly outer membrane protein LptD (OstA)